MPHLRSGKDTIKKHDLRTERKPIDRLEEVFETRRPPSRIRKDTVANTTLGLTGGGLYAICPYDSIDSTGRAIIKIGLASQSLDKRFEQYHTYFPMGIFYISILEKPVIRHGLHANKSLYYKIEQEIIDNVQKLDKESVRLYSTTRQGEEGIGNTEWVYASPDAVTEAFHMAQEKFGGEIIKKHEKFSKNNIYQSTRQIKNGKHVTAEIHFAI